LDPANIATQATTAAVAESSQLMLEEPVIAMSEL